MMQTSSRTSLTSSEQILQKLFIHQQAGVSPNKDNKNQVRINLKLLRKISEDGQNYKTVVELILILQRILFTGNKKLSLRQLIYKSTTGFRNSQKSYSFSSSFGSSFSSISGYSTPKKNNQNLKQIKDQSQANKESQQDQNDKVFVSDELNSQEKQALLECLTKIRSNLSNTIYESKIEQLILSIQNQRQPAQIKPTKEEMYKKILIQSGLGLDGNKNPNIQEFITKGYHSLDGKFTSFSSLYSFLSNQVLPLIERKILSISIRNHQQKQSFITKALTFINQYFFHQYLLQIKINKATLIENRIFQEKVFKQNFKNNQFLIIKNLTNILNQALLCPSNMNIQLPLFRILKRMYNLWGVISADQSHLIELKSQADNIGQIIKYPLLVNLKNISLYSKQVDNQDQIKEAAMFCYKLLNQKEDLYLCNQIQTLSQMRYIKQSKYFSSKAYAFSQQISKIYDTFDLNMEFWKYYKRIQRGQFWTYNLLIEKPNSLVIWEFYLQGYDIGFGIYKVQGMKKHSIEDYSKEVDCKEILKMEKYTVSQSQPQKGFMFLKNGLYRMVFDNTYSSFRGKDLSYMILHLESEG